jgi:hypothetical protein
MPSLGGITEEQLPLPALPGPGAMPSLSALGKPFARPLVQPKKRVATFGSVKPAPFESDAVVAERAQTERAKIAEKAKSEDKVRSFDSIVTFVSANDSDVCSMIAVSTHLGFDHT